MDCQGRMENKNKILAQKKVKTLTLNTKKKIKEGIGQTRRIHTYISMSRGASNPGKQETKISATISSQLGEVPHFASLIHNNE